MIGVPLFGAPIDAARVASFLMWTSIALAAAMAVAVVVERAVAALRQAREWRLERSYQPLVEQALGGDEAACRALAATPPRHHIAIAWLSPRSTTCIPTSAAPPSTRSPISRIR
jgi:hypothetical protein